MSRTERPSLSIFSRDGLPYPTARNDYWWNEVHGLHDETHHQRHPKLDLCVPLWSMPLVLSIEAEDRQAGRDLEAVRWAEQHPETWERPAVRPDEVRTAAGKAHAANFTVALMSQAHAANLTWPEAEANANEIVARIEAEAVAAERRRLAGLVGNAVTEMRNRANDLRWCGKDDDCNVNAKGADLAVADFMDVLEIDPEFRAALSDAKHT